MPRILRTLSFVAVLAAANVWTASWTWQAFGNTPAAKPAASAKAAPAKTAAVVATASATLAPAGDPTAITFEKDVRPILKAHCFHCHGESEKLEGNLDVRLARFLLKGGDSGPAVVAGDVAKSMLLERVQSGEMPPGDKNLSKTELETLRRWVETGARIKRPEPEKLGNEMIITEEERNWWSFRPVVRAAVPAVRNLDQVRTPIDAFLLARLEAKNLKFSPRADRRTLIRRAYFDLTGLPPAPEDVEAFVADKNPRAWENLIDRLLDSPQYGERWGRHWLDVAGYADSEGYTADDPVRAEAFHYRDYVIRSMNADKPFDQFLVEQLAGDELVGPARGDMPRDHAEKYAATGFLRMGPDGTGRVPGAEQKLARNQVVAETLKIVSTSLMGLSVGCAQCHDHRYDPIPQSDYYRLWAVFSPAYDIKAWRAPAARLVLLQSKEDHKMADDIEVIAQKMEADYNKLINERIAMTLEAQLLKVPEKDREATRAAQKVPMGKRDAAQKQLMQQYPFTEVNRGTLYLYDRVGQAKITKMAEEIQAKRASKPKPESLRVLNEIPGKVPDTFLLYRGEPDQPKQKVLPGELSVLDDLNLKKIPENDPAVPTSGRRLAFARRLTDGHHPLTARVLVNRFWMHHFGRGLVGTPGDFGMLGERPTHPELLDWLADDFVRGGWKLKRMHRLIMTSTVYQQVSTRTPQLDQVDAENRLLGRMSLRRLDAEMLRDSVMSVSGKLNRKMFGPPVPVMEDEVGQFVIGIENKNGELRQEVDLPLNGEEFRRTVYVQVRRTRPLGVLDSFDLPLMEPNCELRSVSTVAPQALTLMNNDFIITQSADFAENVIAKAGPDLRNQIVWAWRLAYGREPSAEDLTTGLEFLASQQKYFETHKEEKDKAAKVQGRRQLAPLTPPVQALALYCQALVSSNSFLYVD